MVETGDAPSEFLIVRSSEVKFVLNRQNGTGKLVRYSE